MSDPFIHDPNNSGAYDDSEHTYAQNTETQNEQPSEKEKSRQKSSGKYDSCLYLLFQRFCMFSMFEGTDFTAKNVLLVIAFAAKIDDTAGRWSRSTTNLSSFLISQSVFKNW